jgi:hypothetical protein
VGCSFSIDSPLPTERTAGDNTTAVVRHAMHDAEHHLLDIRRGIARQQLSA